MSKLLLSLLLLHSWSSLPLEGSQLTLCMYAFTCLTCVQPVSSFFILPLLIYTSEHTKCDLVLGNLSVCSVHLCAESRRTVGVVAECALSVTTEPQSGRDVARHQVTSQVALHANYNETPSTDRLRAPSCFPSFCFFILYIGFCISHIATHKLSFCSTPFAKIVITAAVSAYSKQTVPLSNRLLLFRHIIHLCSERSLQILIV